MFFNAINQSMNISVEDLKNINKKFGEKVFFYLCFLGKDGDFQCFLNLLEGKAGMSRRVEPALLVFKRELVTGHKSRNLLVCETCENCDNVFFFYFLLKIFHLVYVFFHH
jgi:hypothetical protein